MPINNRKIGFTIVEVVVSIMVLSLFITVVMYLYSRSSDSFRITLWKQQRTAQAELFWARMRKHLEEATSDLTFELGSANPDLTELPRPFKFHPSPDSLAAGNVMAWGVTRVNFSFTPPFTHTRQHSFFSLAKDGRRIILREGGIVRAELDDVVQISFRVSSVMKAADNSEQIFAGSDPAADGTLVEIAVTLSPPANLMAAHQRIPQNHKFRLNIPSQSDTNPVY